MGGKNDIVLPTLKVCHSGRWFHFRPQGIQGIPSSWCTQARGPGCHWTRDEQQIIDFDDKMPHDIIYLFLLTCISIAYISTAMSCVLALHCLGSAQSPLWSEKSSWEKTSKVLHRCLVQQIPQRALHVLHRKTGQISSVKNLNLSVPSNPPSFWVGKHPVERGFQSKRIHMYK